jgi:hypothetical protein
VGSPAPQNVLSTECTQVMKLLHLSTHSNFYISALRQGCLTTTATTTDYHFIAFRTSWSARVESRRQRQRTAACRLAVNLQRANAASRAPTANSTYAPERQEKQHACIYGNKQKCPSSKVRQTCSCLSTFEIRAQGLPPPADADQEARQGLLQSGMQA